MSLLGESYGKQQYSESSPESGRGFLVTGYTLFSVSILLLVAGIIFRDELEEASRSVLLALGIALLGLSVLFAIYQLFFEQWFARDNLLRSRAFFSRDRRGKRLPGRALQKILQMNSRSKIFEDRPLTELLAMAASEKMEDMHIEILKVLNAKSLRDLFFYSHCAVLAKLDLIENASALVDQAEMETIPQIIWSRARKRLLQSKRPVARIAAVRCTQTPRNSLIQLCADDSETSVRLAAGSRLGFDLTTREAFVLSRSPYVDACSQALMSAKVPLNRSIVLCREAHFNIIRELAWEQIRSDLKQHVAMDLLRSRYEDCRIYAISSGLVPRKGLIKLALKDKAESARKKAYEHVKPVTTSSEAKALLRSHDEKVRLDALCSGFLARRFVVLSCRIDPAETVRDKAWQLIRDDLKDHVVMDLLGSRHEDCRIYAISSGRVPREVLLKLVLKDKAESVRSKAYEHVKLVTTSSEAKALLHSRDEKIRLDALCSSFMTRKFVVLSCRVDPDEAVRDKAWHIIQEKLRNREAIYLSSSRYEQIRLWAVKSGLLSQWRLWWLSRRDRSSQVRSEARMRIKIKKK
jgi:hypothetical protein